MLLWILQFLFFSGLPSFLALSGEHVCSRVENYTVTSREVYTEPVVVQTFTWCLQVPPRCPKSRTEMRSRQRMTTEVKQRSIDECCGGYTIQEIHGDTGVEAKCVPFCENCRMGVCVSPNVCQCDPGYQGDDCAYECPPGSWGKHCMQECECGPEGTCSHVNGICECPPGWQGSRCKVPCPLGRWGAKCASTCECGGKFSSCHPETGECQDVKVMDSHLPRGLNWTMGGLFQASHISTVLEEPTEKGTESSFAGDDWAEAYKFINLTRYPRTTEHVVDENEAVSEIPEVSESLNTDNVQISTYGYTERATIHGSDFTSGTSESTYSISKPPTIISNGNEISSPHDALIPDKSNAEEKILYSSTENIKSSTYQLPQVVDFQTVEYPEIEHDDANTVLPKKDYVKTFQKEDAPSLPFDITALIVVGSVISLGLTFIGLLMIFHMRSRLFESVRLSIYKNDKTENGQEKGNDGKTPKIISSTLPPPPTFVNPVFTASPEGTLITFDGAELNKNYANRTATISIRLSGNLRGEDNPLYLLESHYDRPPAATCCHTVDTEHVYDEIPLSTPLCVRKET